MGGLILLAWWAGCDPDVAPALPAPTTWEGAVPYQTALGAPVDPPQWPIVATPSDEPLTAFGAWAETAARVCRGDEAARAAWLNALKATVNAPEPRAAVFNRGGLSCDRPEFCDWARARYREPGATGALRATLVNASSACDEDADRALRLERLDAHLAAGDVDGTTELLSFLSRQGMTPWLSSALAKRYSAGLEPRLRDALALGTAGTGWGVDDARAAQLCVEQPEASPCVRRASYLSAGVLQASPDVDPSAWLRNWRPAPAALIALRPDLRGPIVAALAACTSEVDAPDPAGCLRALSELDLERARGMAEVARARGAGADLRRVADELLDHPGAGVWLGLSPSSLITVGATRAGRAVSNTGDCAAMWRSALAPDPGLDAAPKRVTSSDDDDAVALELWVDGWWWRAEIGNFDEPCPLSEVVGVANTRLQAHGSPWRWGLVDTTTAVSASDDAWRAALAAGVIVPTAP